MGIVGKSEGTVFLRGMSGNRDLCTQPCTHTNTHNCTYVLTNTARKQAAQEAAGASTTNGVQNTPAQPAGTVPGAPVGNTVAAAQGGKKEKTVAEALAEMAAVCEGGGYVCNGGWLCIHMLCICVHCTCDRTACLCYATYIHACTHHETAAHFHTAQKEAAEDAAALAQTQDNTNDSDCDDGTEGDSMEPIDAGLMPGHAVEDDDEYQHEEEYEQQKQMDTTIHSAANPPEEDVMIVDHVAAAIALNALPHMPIKTHPGADHNAETALDGEAAPQEEGYVLSTGVGTPGGLLGQLATWAGIQSNADSDQGLTMYDEAQQLEGHRDDEGMQWGGGTVVGQDNAMLEREDKGLRLNDEEEEGNTKEEEERPRLTLPPVAGGVCVSRIVHSAVPAHCHTSPNTQMVCCAPNTASTSTPPSAARLHHQVPNRTPPPPPPAQRTPQSPILPNPSSVSSRNTCEGSSTWPVPTLQPA